ncbi:BMC domain-containing protein [Vibrio mimicus]
MRKSLGLLEIKGLASAILVADAMAKTASVTIVGIETCKGGGWQTIKVVGDVAAVQASLSSGSELAKRHNAFVAMKTLSRPDQTIMDTWGVKAPKTAIKAKASEIKKSAQTPVSATPASIEIKSVETESPEPVTEYDIVVEEVTAENTPPEKVNTVSDPVAAEPDSETPVVAEATCNLCGDPLCERVKGEPHTKCIHNTKVK